MAFNRSHNNFHVRSTDAMSMRSSGEWISKRSGPIEIISIPGKREDIRPHSRPAWIASALGV